MLAAMVSLLLGLALGKAWERYKLRDGRWLDRRRLRQSPHYILGLNFLVANQIDLAIEEFSKAASLNERALEMQLLLGNLYREKGQVGRAIQIHQQTAAAAAADQPGTEFGAALPGIRLQEGRIRRPCDRDLRRSCCGSIPENPHALVNLEKLLEDQHQWQEASSRSANSWPTSVRPAAKAITR